MTERKKRRQMEGGSHAILIKQNKEGEGISKIKSEGRMGKGMIGLFDTIRTFFFSILIKLP